MEYQFNCGNILTEVNLGKYLRVTIKSYIQSNVLGNYKESKEMKKKYKRGDKYICPDCGNMCENLQNAHIGFTQEKMVNSIINNIKKEDTIKQLLLEVERYLKYHKHNVDIAVVCKKCNSKYEEHDGEFCYDNSLKYILDYDSDEEKEKVEININSDNDVGNRTIKSLFKKNIKKIDEYPTNIIELFKDFKDKIINSGIGAKSKPLKEKQAKEYIKDLDILFNIIGSEQLNRIFNYYNKKEYIPIIEILKETNENIENHEIKKEWKRKNKNCEKNINNPFLYATPFNKCIIKLLESYID